MTSEAALFAECVANPDDDAPRLVWADRVGGERGELVVIQCDLARGDLSPAEARVRRLRERELLDEHAIEWAGSLAQVARRWSFRRGFVEAARFSHWRSPVEWPLLRAVTVDFKRATWDGIDQVRALGVTSPLGNESLPIAPALRALSLRSLADRDVDNVIDVVSAASIETLRLSYLMVSSGALARILGTASDVTALELDLATMRDDLELPVGRPLRALRLGRSRVHTLAQLRGSTAATSLERLGFELHGAPADLAGVLASLPRVHTIEIGGNVGPAVHAVVDARMPGLRVLRMHGKSSPEVRHAIDERYGAQLELVDVATTDEELVHDSAMLALGAPYLQWTQPAVLARIDRPEIFDIAPYDASDYILLGRSSELPIRLMSSGVARRHARLHWKDGGHEIQDLHSTNGVIIDGERIERARLTDGMLLQLGDVKLRYFIGPGARDRAVAAISGLPTR